MVETQNGKPPDVSDSTQPNPLPAAPNRLCMDAIADTWSKVSGKGPDVFEKEIAQELHMEDASKVDLNKAYMDTIKADEIKKFGPVVGKQVFENGIVGLGCRE
jgi:hypothetical protein